QSGEDRIQSLHNRVFAANHLAIAAFQSPDAAAGANVDVVQAFLVQLFGAAQIVDVIGIAAVDENVAALEPSFELGDALVDRPGRHHQPDSSWFGKLGH